MRSSYIFGVVAAIITYVAMWLDQKLFDNPKKKVTYFKNMVFVGLLVGGGIYLLGEENFEGLIGFGTSSGGGSSSGGMDYRSGGRYDDMLTGNPDF